MKRFTTVISAVALAVTVTSPVMAKDYNAKGNVEFNVLASTGVGGENSGLVRLQAQGVIKQEGGTSPIAGTTQNCTGIYKMNAEGVALSGAGYCDAIDGDGDMYAIHWSENAGNGKWSISWGTGKFEGAKGGGTTKVLPAPGENMLAVSWDGSWSMK